jgi:nucleoside-diphosphate-sugar epimerase
VKRWSPSLSIPTTVVGLDLHAPQRSTFVATFEKVDLTSDRSVAQTLKRICKSHDTRIASVIHLAAYFDLTGEPNPKYEQITVRGTERLIRGLQSFEVEQFVFTSSMLVHRAVRPGGSINENSPLERIAAGAAMMITPDQCFGDWVKHPGSPQAIRGIQH